MTTKRKTVKELNDIIDVLIDRVKKLEDHGCNCNREQDLEELKRVEDMIVETNGKVESLAKNQENNNIQDKEQTEFPTFKCKKCDDNFDSKRKLKEHFVNDHPVEVKCKECGERFEEHWKFERHIKGHGKDKEFHCDKCDKTYYTKWRLGKHQESHSSEVTKYCHYFNNFKECPYEEFGCKFQHEESKDCRFQRSCKNALCQFRHRDSEDEHESWKCKETNWMNAICEFQSCVELRLKNHMLAEH
jgi:hypothetical protein